MKTMKTLITIIRSVVARVGVAGRNFLSVQLMKANLNLLQTRIFAPQAAAGDAEPNDGRPTIVLSLQPIRAYPTRQVDPGVT
jgi:hypothetical protein